ncbi:MAG TPA: glycosyltransferase N-terminal domain-containing protein [Myxococcota bacterium]|nr:glycosyltransferase N-terminal domain-containing protein [Myxococcota bacterium]
MGEAEARAGRREGGWQRALYRAAWWVAAPLAAAGLSVAPRLRAPLRERFGRFGADVARGGVWLHGASAGDVRALLPLVRALAAAGGVAPLLTSSTRAGREVGGEWRARALPLDHPWCVGAALDAVAPRALLLEARELWPELVLGAVERGVRCVVVNARLSERSAAAYRRWAGLCGPLLAAPVRWCAVDASAAAALAAAGVDPARVRVTGDTKIEAALDAAAGVDGSRSEGGEGTREGAGGAGARGRAGETREGGAPGRAGEAREGGAPRVVLGSVHDGAEWRALMAALEPIAAAHPEALFDLVPRYPAEGAAMARRLSRAPALGARTSVLARMGVLRAAYGGALAAFVGGSLADRGAHNVVEPAAAGVPFVVGPSRRNARAALAALRGTGAVEAEDAPGVAAAIGGWLADPVGARAAGAALRARAERARGAVARTLAVLAELGLAPAPVTAEGAAGAAATGESATAAGDGTTPAGKGATAAGEGATATAGEGATAARGEGATAAAGERATATAGAV